MNPIASLKVKIVAVRVCDWCCKPYWQVLASATAITVTDVCSKLLQSMQGVCCQIMSIPNSMLGLHPVDDKQADRKYPPTVFAHMVRDKRTAQGVAENAEFLRKQVCMPWSATLTIVAVAFCSLSQGVAENAEFLRKQLGTPWSASLISVVVAFCSLSQRVAETAEFLGKQVCMP